MTSRRAAPLRVAMVYHFWAHYREPVMAALDRDPTLDITFFGSVDERWGIALAHPDAVRHFEPVSFRPLGPISWQTAGITAALRDYDVIVYLGDPRFASTWLGAVAARLRGRRVMFWGHGWLREHRGLRRAYRHLFFRLADRVLVYAPRARLLAESSGFPAERVSVIFNSLDVAAASAVVRSIENGEHADADPRRLFADPARPLIICTARLTPLCRFDLLLEAAAMLGARGTPVNVLLVGDGPCRDALERQARALGVDAHFYGAVYDEDAIGPLLYGADVTVSPGKVGLTAMHSMMYGTPVITHGALDRQMPEVAAVRPGETGAFFAVDDAHDLADTITGWLDKATDRAAVRAACRAEIEARWTPEIQAELIAAQLHEVVGDRPHG